MGIGWQQLHQNAADSLFAPPSQAHSLSTLALLWFLVVSRPNLVALVCPLLTRPLRVLVQVRIELYDRKQTKFISAHNTPLVCMTLSMDGKRLATASDKGTLIRVWNTADGALLQVGGPASRGGTSTCVAMSTCC